MSSLIVLLGTCIMIVNLVIYVGFSIASIILVGYCVLENSKSKDMKKSNIVPRTSVVVRKQYPLTGVPTWKRINGRLVKKYYIVDIENDSYGYTPEKKVLDKVKKKLFSVWDRVNGRLVRTGSY